MDRNKAEKRMATAPVGRLMLQMGTPMILIYDAAGGLQHCGQLFCGKHGGKR